MTAIRLRINGAEVAEDVPPRLSLADFLRRTGPLPTALSDAVLSGELMNLLCRCVST